MNIEPVGEIRIGYDTSGIASGADQILTFFKNQLPSLRPDIRIKAVGATGLCYADPQIEIDIPGLPHGHYGKLTEEFANRILKEHILKGNLVSSSNHTISEKDCGYGYLLAGRKIGKIIPETITQIAIADVSPTQTEMSARVLRELLNSQNLSHIQIASAHDFGFFGGEIYLQFFPGELVYERVRLDDFENIILKSILQREVLEEFLPVNSQVCLVTKRLGKIDPESIDDYLNHSGYSNLRNILTHLTPEQVIQNISDSELRGRGGAGYPTGKKWELTRKASSKVKYAICNADEGDPGAFKDRCLLEGDPHSVIEGLIISGYAIGANLGYIYIRAEYPLATKRVRLAIQMAHEKGFLGRNILGSDFSFDIKVRLGAGAYVCGEETALIASLEGKRGSPIPRPPYPSVKGLYGEPTCINNVETLATVSHIASQDPTIYQSIGEGESRGTKVFSVTGKVRCSRLVEVAMGTSLRDIIYALCGGARTGKKIKAVQTGGPSGGVIPENLFDTHATYETMLSLGSILGSGGMIVMDDDDNMVKLVRFYLDFNVDESCGKCPACRIGGFQLKRLFDKLTSGTALPESLSQIERIGHAMQKASLCGLGQAAPNPLFSTMRYFRNEYESFLNEARSK